MDARRLLTDALAAALVLWSLYSVAPINLILPDWALQLLPLRPPVETYKFRWVHLALILALAALTYAKSRARTLPLLLLAFGGLLYQVSQFDRFVYSAATPSAVDVAVGLMTIGLLIYVVYRSSGLAVTLLLLFFIVYAMTGYYWPEPFTHRGYSFERLVGHLYMTLEGIFGVAIDVSATLVILFVAYGALMDASGASKFFMELVYLSMGRSPSAAGRATVLLTALIGGPQGSGVATTLSVGPLVKEYLLRAGYPREKAAGLLSAGGIGAVISPPLLGAAAFLMMEFLRIPLISVMVLVLVPTLLIYAVLYVTVWLESKALDLKPVELPKVEALRVLRGLYHLLSMAVLIAVLLVGRSPGMAITSAIFVTIVTSFLSRDRSEWLTPRRLLGTLIEAGKSFLPVGCILAGVGIVIGVFTLTGLGLKLAGIIVAASGGIREVAVLLSGLAVILVGLAVPITASYVVTAAVVTPALAALGIPPHVSHVFVFYYAVLSEVSPPIGLAPMAAASIFGGNPFRTMMEAWRYTLPAFVIPFFFTFTADGEQLLLLQDPKNVVFFDPLGVIVPLAASIVGVVFLSAAMAGHLFSNLSPAEVVALAVAGSVIGLYPENQLAVLSSLVVIAGVLSAQIAKTRVRNSRATPAQVQSRGLSWLNRRSASKIA
ncbi:MAG: TRAP transporter fused permease subunit [Candidatus Caldarchaeales archaeon]